MLLQISLLTKNHVLSDSYKQLSYECILNEVNQSRLQRVITQQHILSEC